MRQLIHTLVVAVCGLAATLAHASGSLKCTLSPAAAVTAGARWQVDGGAWQNSGATVKGLFAGSHAVGFRSVSGWIAPQNTHVTIANGNTTTLTAAYIQAASVAVTLSPANAQWRIDGGAWQGSGSTVDNLVPGTHAIDYSGVAGYQTPASESVTLAAGQALTLSRTYVAYAQLTVTLSPGTAQYRVDGGAWQPSGATLSLLPGTHTVDYSPVTGYATPASESLSVAAGQIVSLARTYIQYAQVTVTISPDTAQWQIDGGAWQSSGATVANLMPGNHGIRYGQVSGYASLSPESVSLSAGQSLVLTRSYEQLADLTITLNAPGAQWRVDAGEWRASGATVTGLMPGAHPIDYANVDGYVAPPSETWILGGGSNALTRSYTQLASLTVSLTPSAGQWRVDGGAWQSSGATVALLAQGSHSVDYASVDGYVTPASENCVLAGGANYLTRAYTELASLTVSLTPSTGQWRLDGGAWQASDATLTGLALGSHTLEYAPLAGYNALAGETVTLSSGANPPLARTYTAITAALTTYPVFLDAGYPAVFLRGSDGRVYAATNSRGANNGGQIFAVNADGSGYTLVHAFLDYVAPNSLCEGPDGMLYGVTQYQSGTSNASTMAVFRVNKDGSGFAMLKTFSAVPYGPSGYLTMGTDGVLYGIWYSSSSNGTLFRLNRDGSGYGTLGGSYGAKAIADGGDGSLYLTTTASPYGGTYGSVFRVDRSTGGHWLLRNFDTSTEAGAPKAGLLCGSDGALYGTTSDGGTYNKGTVYRLNRDGSGFAVLHAFPGDATDGGRLDAGLAEGPDGRLYGLTYGYGPNGRGTLFRMAKDGTGYAVLRAFAGAVDDGGVAALAPVVAPDGSVFGVNTFGGGDNKGVVFVASADGSSFNKIIDLGAPDGAQPRSLMAGGDGFLYGVTENGGGSTMGAVFRMAKDGSGYTVLKRFALRSDGNHPWASVIQASDGALYGTTITSSGGGMDIYRLNPDGSGYSILRAFTDGSQSASPLLEASDGVLYGTTLTGGGAGYGSVFRINKDGSGFAVLRAFANNSTDGNTPSGGLVEGPDGLLYGTNSAAGTGNVGTIFAITKDGTQFTVLHTFAGGATDGATPYAALTIGSNGRLYGSTHDGGASGLGVIFTLNRGGTQYAVLHDFAGGSDGAAPLFTSLVEKDGALYGITNAGGVANDGTAFLIGLDGSVYRTLTSFGANSTDGLLPGGLALANDGALYGTTYWGGLGGTVFQLKLK